MIRRKLALTRSSRCRKDQNGPGINIVKGGSPLRFKVHRLVDRMGTWAALWSDFREFGMGDVYSCKGCSWVNGDIGPEWRFPFNMLACPFVGMSVLMGARQENSPPYISASKGPGMTLGYVGVALGALFDS